ncbi:MAG: CCA tRNA nucleotidyltransferase [Lachnospiraceae bacterium]|nr:CCA tRNA nucleotidyltransferase [Lachnospiraceae bacterium]
MKITLPEKVDRILDTLMQAGYEAYAVGGCVRDSILGKKPEDWDITTSATPEEVKKIFHRTIDTGIEHGTVTVMLEREGFEVTTYRIDGKYEDSRHPKEVTFTPNLLEDLKRRDFTINAMAYNNRDGLVDAFDGIGDLGRKIIRCVGNPMERFDEDALRMMRAVRFAAQLGFSIEEKTVEAIKILAPTLEKISAERIQVELVKLLISDHPEEMRTLYKTGITAVMLPEFDVMMQTDQNNPHHMYTVGEHTLAALENAPKDKVLRLTMLLHDVAKPVCKTTDEDGVHHFHHHPQKGSEMARAILRRLKFDNDTTDRVCNLVKWHDDNPPITAKSIRRAIVRLGNEAYPAIFAVKRADILAQSTHQRTEKLAYVEEYEACYQQILEQKQCLCLKDLAVSGGDLIAAGMKPGKELGQILKELLDMVLEEPEKNQKELLLLAAKEKFK